MVTIGLPRPRKGEACWSFRVPDHWIMALAQLSNTTFMLGIYICSKTHLKEKSPLELRSSDLEKEFGINRASKLRGLQQMERAGLVKVIRRAGKNPLVYVLFEGGK